MSSAKHRRLIQKLQAIIGTDAGHRGMSALIVPDDLHHAAECFAQMKPSQHVVILSGFPCCVQHTPPTETDGPPGTAALAQTALALSCQTTVVTDKCNEDVFRAGLQHLPSVVLECFPANMTREDDQRLAALASNCDLLLACERAGPAVDGKCYTMRGIDMEGLVAPLHRLVHQVQARNVPFIAIGDGGNEMGMGKVLSQIHATPQILNSVACVVPADYLIAASVSNWGAYALAAATGLLAGIDCLPTPEQEVELLQRCIQQNCRDGVSGRVEMTVDGMPLETSLQCLRDLREVVLSGQTDS
ncbi:hypothetical protein FisN_17Hh076 [Fistulifera solaris]|uniref:D-glutamate cyclase-like C-terminal domain-containing protein n=1 Tax=Fistulifera solaris TaxID=1519565 RepID=A0A1Z5JGL4_FISSO|nr:hypothetical protein FisN_17Hh076 [Fistulifera solaris]|eukprot:GAX13147.1 hypothetical protein FisN_17Hh076 [Fistulifera solaris]